MSRHPVIGLSAAVAAVAALAVATSADAFTPPPFPRLGGIEIGGPANYNDTTYQDNLAKLSLMILKYTPGYAPGGESMDSIIAAIKAKNPDALVFLYTNADGQTLTGTDTRAPLREKINAMKWWLYPSASTADPVPSFFGHGEYTINNTPYTQKDSDGNDSIDWITQWYVNNYYKPNPAIDGFFMDNVFAQPKVAGDWTRDGVLLQPTASKAAAALEAGYERWFQLTRQLMPGKYQIANLGSWGRGNTSIPGGYQDMVDGGVLEAMIGESYSVESWGGWQEMMTQYDKVMQVVRSPKLVIFNQWGSPTDYQSFRYGLASCLMNNAYYSFTSSSAGYDGVVWFDEYDAQLGDTISIPPTSAWQKGVWRRDFADGIALVNPKGNGPQTVSLGGSFVKIKGTQDPAVNDGATVTSVTLQDRDGIILLRQSPLERPKAPTAVSAGTG